MKGVKAGSSSYSGGRMPANLKCAGVCVGLVPQASPCKLCNSIAVVDLWGNEVWAWCFGAARCGVFIGVPKIAIHAIIP